MTTKQRSQRELQRLVNQFNSVYPLGTRVYVTRKGREIETRVKAPAQIWAAESAVAWFDGIVGPCSIEDDAVRPAKLKPVA